MSILIDIETDYLFKTGIAQGVAQGKAEGGKIERTTHSFVKNLILGTDFSDDKIADIANVITAFVQKVRADLK
jgi:hypothetical protein